MPCSSPGRSAGSSPPASIAGSDAMTFRRQTLRMLVPEASQSSPPERRQRIAVLGSTGSIGRQTLDVVQHHPGRFEIVALAAGSWSPILAQQIATFRPALVAIDDQANNLDRGSFKLLRGTD